MNAYIATLPSPALPWTTLEEDDRRFLRILLVVALLFLLMSVLIPWLPVFQPERPPVEESAPRYVELLLERTPPQVMPEPEPQPVPAQQEVADAPAPTAESRRERPRQTAPEQAREKAENSGVLAMRDSLAALRGDGPTGQLRQGPLAAGVERREPVERSIVSSKVGGGSGGIDTSTLSRGFGSGSGGTALGGHSTGRVDSPVGGLEQAQRRGGKGAGRTNEEIQLVFDRNKSSIYALYNRALRTNAGLQGKVVLKLTIAPSGAVTAIDMISSELRDAELERRLLLRVKAFEFGPKDVPTVTVTYPIEFFPS